TVDAFLERTTVKGPTVQTSPVASMAARGREVQGPIPGYHGPAVRRMEAIGLERPRVATVHTPRQAPGAGSQDQAWMTRWRQHLMDIGVYVEGRLPGGAVVGRSNDAPDVDVRVDDPVVVSADRPDVRRPAPRRVPVLTSVRAVEPLDGL